MHGPEKDNSSCNECNVQLCTKKDQLVKKEMLISFILHLFYERQNRETRDNMATVAFCAALGQMGFMIATQNAIVAQGFDVINGLIILGKDDIYQICKIIHDDPNPVAIPFMQQQLFEAMHYWVKTKTHHGKSTSAMLFTLAVAHEYAEKMIIDMEEIAKTDKESVKLPEKLPKQSMWLVFRDAMAS